MLVLEAVNRDNTPHTTTIPLAGFAEIYDGPPTPMSAMQEIASEAEMNALRERANVPRRNVGGDVGRHPSRLVDVCLISA